MASSELKFEVRRQEPVLVRPCSETPREILNMSNLDDQAGLRFHIPVVQFYRRNPARDGVDPREAIKESLAKVLVHYYPFAGRLRHAEDGKLCVDCTGEGVYFIAAEADVSLADFGDLKPPFPCWTELLYEIPGSESVTDTPLLLIQVTTLKCGGFIFALRLNHTMSDAVGLVQFMTALGEMCYGAHAPALPPIWKRRSLLSPRSPPQISVPLHEYEQVQGEIFPVSEMWHDSFYFGHREISLLRAQSGCAGHIPTFEILSACLWQLRTRSLKFPPSMEVRLIFPLDARARVRPAVEKGYYGNVICFACAKARAGDVAGAPLAKVAELIGAAKAAVTDEYMRSVSDAMETYGRPHFTVVGSFLLSDLSKIGFDFVDLGWGRPAYGGAAKGGVGAVPGVSSFLIPRRRDDGAGVATLDSVLVPMCLPAPAMTLFRTELARLLNPELRASL